MAPFILKRIHRLAKVNNTIKAVKEWRKNRDKEK
jgi:hypothetical protein